MLLRDYQESASISLFATFTPADNFCLERFIETDATTMDERAQSQTPLPQEDTQRFNFHHKAHATG